MANFSKEFNHDLLVSRTKDTNL